METQRGLEEERSRGSRCWVVRQVPPTLVENTCTPTFNKVKKSISREGVKREGVKREGVKREGVKREGLKRKGLKR